MWECIDDWLATLRAAGRPDTTVSLRRYQLRRFAAAHPQGPAALAEADLVAWLGAQEWERETLRSHRAALRLFFAWAARAEVVQVDPARGLPRVAPSRALPRPAPEWALESARGVDDRRVRLMVDLAAVAGLRRAEIAQARSDWLVENVHGYALRVLGKGDRVRIVPIPSWLAVDVRARGEGWLFPGQCEGHLSAWWVGRLVTRALPEGWTTHTLRHRFATRVYSGSRDLLATQALLGHSKPETTTRYVALDAEWLREASSWAA